jgi:FixJ family two-component response regulator
MRAVAWWCALANPSLISIVDDDPSIREATMSLLEAYGYTAAAFASAEEFLGSEHLARTSCLVTDVRMAGLSGLELLRHLLSTGYPIPTIVVTAHPEAHVRTTALDLGARHFLTKPVREESFISCLEGVLGGPSTEQVEP